MNGKSTVDRIITGAIIAVCVLSLLLGVLLIVRRRMYRPRTDTETPFQVGDVTDVGAGFTRERGKYNFLCIGVDKVAGLSDTMMIVSVGTGGDIAVVQLPRDTYVGGAKLNSLYASGGAEALSGVIGSSLCVKIDYTVVIGTDVFREAVDAIGGVELTVPADMDYEDPEQDLYIHIKAGKQVLNGTDAEGFVRYRSGYAGGDLDRIDAQKTFLKALLRKIREDTGFDEASALLKALLPRVSADIPVNDALWFLELMFREGLRGSDGLVMMTLPGKALYSKELKTSFFVIGRSGALETVNTYLNVFDTEITEEIFDSQRKFVRAGDDEFERIYTYSILSPKTVRG